MCDNKCNKEGFKFYQLAAIVVEDGGAAHTINLCKPSYNEMRMKRGDRKVTAARWRERGKLWVTFGMEQTVQRIWEHFTMKKGWARTVLAVAERERGKKGENGFGTSRSTKSWSLSLTAGICAFKVYQVRRAYYAGKSGDSAGHLEEFREDDMLSVWASIKVRECYNEVEAEDEGRLSIAQGILRKSTDFLRRIFAPNGGAGAVTFSYVCPHCHSLLSA